MRQGANKRSRGRNGRNKPHMPLRMQTFDSSGPDVRIRGSAWQVHERYLNLARDASAAGDRVAAENFFQHADHYYRLINLNGEGRPPQHGGHQGQQPQGGPPPHMANGMGHGPQGQGPGPEGQGGRAPGQHAHGQGADQPDHEDQGDLPPLPHGAAD
ncbi:MAG: DUF4167 domain-containing protein [Alphaproteobacteria bacterium]|nr:DUF4167 domain-containing protein [Alphaproteobacteria bacterium]